MLHVRINAGSFCAMAVVCIAGLIIHLCSAMKLFGLYGEGVIFTAESVARIRRIGVTLLLVPGVWLGAPIASIDGQEARRCSGYNRRGSNDSQPL
jgi:hypothetical protein